MPRHSNAPIRALRSLVFIFAAVLLATINVGAGAARAQGNAPAADAALTADRTKSDALTPDQRAQAQRLFELAFELLQSGDLESARLGFDRGLAIDPANAMANFYLAGTLLRQGNRDRARILYNKVIALDPKAAIALQAEVALKTLAGSSPQTAPAQADATPAPLSPAREQALRAKESFKECADCPEMVVMPAGSFTMGAPDDEWGRKNDEQPMHQVTFSRPFAVGKFAVTFGEWDACAADGGCNGYRPPDNGWGRGRQPVIFVSWNDAKNYLAWLSRKTGKTYRLLSESEREYVTRAGTSTAFWWGAQLSAELANYNGNYAFKEGPKGPFRGRTMPVESFAPNPWGLYQVHGNVAEWIEDCIPTESYAGAPSDGSPWVSGRCDIRILRGGSWDEIPAFVRAAARIGSGITFRNHAFGFRVARDISR